MPIRVTLDTNILDRDGKIRISNCTFGTDIELACVTVSDRELHNSTSGDVHIGSIQESGVWGESKWGALWSGHIREDFVIGESPLGTGQIGGSGALFELVLATISSGSFPKRGMRDNLSKGERRQLRDAMIFVAHVRESREIFVTNDQKGFVGHGRREALEGIGRTKIMTIAEFEDFAYSIPREVN